MTELEQMVMELLKSEQDGTAESCMIEIGPFSMYQLIGALQLALRHPELPANIYLEVRKIAGEMAQSFAEGSALRDSIEKGFDADHDVIRGTLVSIPYRAGAADKFLACAKCQSALWIASSDGRHFQCNGCQAVYKRKDITAQVKALTQA